MHRSYCLLNPFCMTYQILGSRIWIMTILIYAYTLEISEEMVAFGIQISLRCNVFLISNHFTRLVCHLFKPYNVNEPNNLDGKRTVHVNKIHKSKPDKQIDTGLSFHGTMCTLMLAPHLTGNTDTFKLQFTKRRVCFFVSSRNTKVLILNSLEK